MAGQQTTRLRADSLPRLSFVSTWTLCMPQGQRGWSDTEPMGKFLAEEHGLAVVPGVYFSAYSGEWVRFSYATPPERTQGAAERLLEGLGAL